MKIEILYSPDCPNYEKALELVDAVLDETGIEAQVELVRVMTEGDARTLNFAGSPTVFVEGMDVDYTDPHLKPIQRRIGLHCRLYREDGHLQGWPSWQMLLDSIEMAYLVDKGQFGRCC